MNWERLSSEATTSASQARARLSRELIIWANCPYISDRVCSGCINLTLVSENPDMFTVGLGKELPEGPTGRATKVVGDENSGQGSALGCSLTLLM